MDKYAIIKIGSSQLTVHEGDILKVDRQGDNVVADVLLYSDGKETIVGTPFLKEAHVVLKNTGDERGAKLRVSRFKSKSRYRKTRGYRDSLSVLKVESITLGAEKEQKEVVKEPKKAVEKAIKTTKTVKKAVTTAKKAAKKSPKKEAK